jgi:transcriptional regulator with XRE-family HTH domain
MASTATDIFIGARLRELRIKRGISQADSGKPIRVTFQQMQKYESGGNRLRATQLHTLAKFYGVSMDHFFPNSSPSNPAQGRYTELDRQAQAVMDFAVTKKGFALMRAFLALDEHARAALLTYVRLLARRRT